ncbi:MAG: ABC transporter permease [Caldisericia bacterium]|jgi:simple sugar transport system permease protein|nr:ABC transporter permease [Caldisericia bacterium]
MNDATLLIYSILKRALISGTPLLLGTLGEIYTERSGVLNLGIEGLMAIGAISGFGITYATGNIFLGFIFAILFGIGLSLIHAFISITLKGNQTISGLALTMFGLGVSGFWGKAYIGKSISIRIKEIEIFVLNKIPFLGDLIFKNDIIIYTSWILTFLLWFILYKTKWGIIIRSCGENPLASDSMGVNVNLVRYISVMIGGALSGLAGAYLSLVYTPMWIEGMTGGRGWIVIALTIFSLWNPSRAVLGAYLFGGIYILQYILQLRYKISPNLLLMLPYFVTLIVLLLSAEETIKKRIGAPKFLGEPYIKEEK